MEQTPLGQDYMYPRVRLAMSGHGRPLFRMNGNHWPQSSKFT